MTIDRDYQMLTKQIMKNGEISKTRNASVKRSFYPFVIRCFSAPIVGWRTINHHLGIREMDCFINGEQTMHSSIKPWWEPFKKKNTQGQNWYDEYYYYLDNIIDSIKTKPTSRRHVLSAWDYKEMSLRENADFLTNCHSTVCQFYVDNSKKLHYKTYQRSADVMLGLPYNLIQHWALLEYVAFRTNYKPGSMSYILGDSHIYKDHWKTAEELCNFTSEPKNNAKLVYSPTGVKFRAFDFKIKGEIDFPIKTKLRMNV